MELATERYSVRDFSPKIIDENTIKQILAAGAIAPTAVNYQPQKIYVLQSPDAMSRMNSMRPMFGAPAALLVCYDKNLSWKNRKDNGHDSGEVDAAIVTTHMMLRAQELGVGSCWIGSFSPAEVREAFGIPENEEPVAILAIGYASESCTPSDFHLTYRNWKDYVKFI